jgi:hypothetical protein
MEFAISTVQPVPFMILAFKDHLTDAMLQHAQLMEPNVMRVPTETLLSVFQTLAQLAHLMDLLVTAHLVHSARLQRLPLDSATSKHATLLTTSAQASTKSASRDFAELLLVTRQTL